MARRGDGIYQRGNHGRVVTPERDARVSHGQTRGALEGGWVMAQYAVHVFCDECSGVHSMGIRLTLDDGPADKASVGDTYAGRDLPEAIALLIENQVECPVTGRLTRQRDHHQVFLVPIA